MITMTQKVCLSFAALFLPLQALQELNLISSLFTFDAVKELKYFFSFQQMRLSQVWVRSMMTMMMTMLVGTGVKSARSLTLASTSIIIIMYCYYSRCKWLLHIGVVYSKLLLIIIIQKLVCIMSLLLMSSKKFFARQPVLR